MMRIFQFDSCPFCARVRAALADLGLEEGKDYELVSSYPGEPGRDETRELGGKEQFPFLVDGDVMMYESSDIIEYLEKKYRK